MLINEYAKGLAQRARRLAESKAKVCPGFDPKRNLERALHDTLSLVQGIERNMRNSVGSMAQGDFDMLTQISGDVTQAYELSRVVAEQLIEIGLEIARRKREEEAEPESLSHDFGVRLVSFPGADGDHYYATTYVELVRRYEKELTHELSAAEAKMLNERDETLGAYNRAGDVSRRFFDAKQAAAHGARYLMETYDVPLGSIRIECVDVDPDEVIGWTVLVDKDGDIDEDDE